LRDDGSTVLGSFADLPRLVREKRISRVLVAFSPRRDEDLVRVLRECDASGVDVDIVPRLFEYLGMEAYISTVGDLPVLHVRAQRAGRAAKLAKRSLDVAIASILGLALLPVIAVVALSIAVTDGRPIIYRQARIGRGGREFAMLKFRTMLPDADEIGLSRIDGLTQGTINVADAVERLKPDHDPRITRLGRFLRRSSLDELPQLWNVLRNEMSLVGPRPLRAFEVDALDAWQLVRQDVRPGITGLWQVLGRSSIEWDDRMQLDYTYVRHWNAWYDLKILARTVPAVFRRHGAR
jgi:exopolysaccharide biosynthesis polyprenyl glycosylphosphotransferase